MQITEINRSNVDAVTQSAEPAAKKAAADTSAVEYAAKKTDEYVPTEKEEPIGLYKKTVDDNGNAVIEFDKATETAGVNADADSAELVKKLSTENIDSSKGKTSDKTENKPQSQVKAPPTKTASSKGEIKKLKENAKQIKKQITSADGQDANRLRAKLKAVEAEISRKSK